MIKATTGLSTDRPDPVPCTATPCQQSKKKPSPHSFLRTQGSDGNPRPALDARTRTARLGWGCIRGDRLPVSGPAIGIEKQMKTYAGAGSSLDVALDGLLSRTTHGGGVRPRGRRVLVSHVGFQNLKAWYMARVQLTGVMGISKVDLWAKMTGSVGRKSLPRLSSLLVLEESTKGVRQMRWLNWLGDKRGRSVTKR